MEREGQPSRLRSSSLPSLLRHLVAVTLLPGTVVILVPIWIAGRYEVGWSLPASRAGFMPLVLGAVLMAVGVLLFGASLHGFATRGRGTLAPWDPPRALVVHGPYRFVRNPMISGVILILIGEALLLRSLPHGVWALAFLGLNAVYIPLLEEPWLEARFGDEYGQYRANVPRLVPRLRPWRG